MNRNRPKAFLAMESMSNNLYGKMDVLKKEVRMLKEQKVESDKTIQELKAQNQKLMDKLLG